MLKGTLVLTAAILFALLAVIICYRILCKLIELSEIPDFIREVLQAFYKFIKKVYAKHKKQPRM